MWVRVPYVSPSIEGISQMLPNSCPGTTLNGPRCCLRSLGSARLTSISGHDGDLLPKQQVTDNAVQRSASCPGKRSPPSRRPGASRSATWSEQVTPASPVDARRDPASPSITRRCSFRFSINQHRRASESINQHRQVSTSIDQHRTSIDRLRQAPTSPDMYRTSADRIRSGSRLVRLVPTVSDR